MASNYQSFIKAMQEKYMGVFDRGLDGVPLTAVAPSSLMNRGNVAGQVGNATIAVPAGQGAGTGARYTGRGPVDQPAGIVDGNEMVVEAPMIDKIGGPGRVREGLEVLADMKKKGVARSFQTGTGDETAGDANAAWDAWKKKANYSEATHGTEASLRPTFDKWHSQYGKSGKDFNAGMNQSDWAGTYGTQGTTGGTANPPGFTPQTPDSLGMPKAPPVRTAEDVTKGMTDRGVSRFAETTDEAMENLKKIASGDSDAMKTASQFQGQQLAGVQAARSSALGQQLAQQGVEGGAARVAQAMESRQAGVEQAGLKGQLAVEQQQRMERATSQLVSAGLQGEQLEEAKHQFDVGVQKWGTEFEEASKQWGANFSQRQAEFTATANQWGKEFAFAQEKFNYGKALDAANMQMTAGDYDGLATTFKNLGFDINVDTLKDKATFDKLTRDMDTFTSNAATFGINSPQATDSLKNMFMTQHPEYLQDGKLTPEGEAAFNGTKDKPGWLETTKSAYEIKSSPYRSALEAMRDEDYDLMAASFGFEDISTFSFNGETGKDAIKDWCAAYLLNPQALTDTNSALYKAMNPESTSGGAASVIGPALNNDAVIKAIGESLSRTLTDDEIKSVTEKLNNAPIGATEKLSNKLGEYVKQADGTWKKKGETTSSDVVRTQAGYDIDSDDPLGDAASQILSQPRTSKNSVVYDSIVKARVENMAKTKDYTSLRGKTKDDPVYKEALKKTSAIPMKTTYKENKKGFNKELYGIDWPSGTKVGEPVNIDGVMYILDADLPANIIDQRYPKPNKHEARYAVTDPLTGAKRIVKAGGDAKVVWEK